MRKEPKTIPLTDAPRPKEPVKIPMPPLEEKKGK